MGQKRVGDFIRSINFLKLSEEEGNEAGNQLIDIEKAVSDNPQIDEVKDGFKAYMDKVGEAKFPERHSGGYWAAYSAINVLTRLVREFDEDEKAAKEFGKIYLDTWLALLRGGPSSGQTKLMSELHRNLFEDHLKTLDKKQLADVFSKMKITFHYDPAIEKDTDERVYADILHDAIAYLFKCLEQEQLVSAQKEFLDLYGHYQKQLSGLSEVFARYVGYLLRDMAAGFPDENPFMVTQKTEEAPGSPGQTQEAVVAAGLPGYKDSLEMLKGLICDGQIKSQEQFNKLRAETTLKTILKAIVNDDAITAMMEPLMTFVVDFSKSPGSEFGKEIYDSYGRYLFRELRDKEYVPDAKVFETVLDMIIHVNVLTNLKESTEGIEYMIRTAVDECLMKYPDKITAMSKKLVDAMICMVKSGRVSLIQQAVTIVREKELSRNLVWKNHIDEVKMIMHIIGKKQCSEMEKDKRGEIDDALRKYRDFCEYFLKSVRKAKVVDKVQKELMVLIFDCMEVDNPQKADMGSKCCDDLSLQKPDKDLIMFILEKSKAHLLNKDFNWDIDCIVCLQDILQALIESYNENGKLVTPEQHQLFVDIFNIVMDGDTVDEHFLTDEEQETVFLRIYQTSISLYFVLHRESSTVDCFIDVIPGILKWARISTEENCEKVMDTSFTLLQICCTKPIKGLEKYLKEIMDLMFESERYTYLQMLIVSLYPNNPGPVHDRLQDMFEKFPMLKDDDQMMVLNIIMTVSSNHPEAFTEGQVKALVDWHLNTTSNESLLLVIIRYISEKRAGVLAPHLKSFLKPDTGSQPIIFSMKLYVIGNVAVQDKKLAEDSMDFMVSCFNHKDPSVLHVLTGQIGTVMKSSPDYMQKHRSKVENLQKTATTPAIRDGCTHILNVLDGKNIEDVFEDVQQTKGTVTDIDKKVGATMNTVVSLGEHVIEQDKDISKLQTDMDILEERVDDVEEDLGETKIKVEEIDNKTMTNAPKWSRDLTKLMNPRSDADWRLLAQRLGYSNDDIRGWAQQNDPCMALLSEWYATHKTSEATHAVLKILEDMNRQDGVVIVENAMKCSEDVVEDEEFEYPNPPPIFLSYQWGMQNEVKLLKQHLQMAGFECWMDIGQMGGGDKLFNKIDDGIRAAKVVISCTTEKYAKSPNCNREVNLAVNLGKPIIPLLMEKMAWPPKGSMGPIFSEYLFIRFFQRGGEETTDQRYWPLPKFNELLMQINFFVVPDESLVKEEYKNWWNPIAEEIVIDKNKLKGSSVTAQSQTQIEESGESPLVFLSYQWGRQPQVKALYQRLISLGYTIWMDIYQMGGGDSLYDKIDRGLRGCKVVVSCVTPKYALSANCRREISLADALKKPIIPLLLEEMKWPPDGPMSMVFTELLFINMWRDPNIQTTWTGQKFSELQQKLQQYIPGSKPVENGTDPKEDKGKNNQVSKGSQSAGPAKSPDKNENAKKAGGITSEVNGERMKPKDSSHIKPNQFNEPAKKSDLKKDNEVAKKEDSRPALASANKSSNLGQAQSTANKSLNPQQTQTASNKSLKPQQAQTAANKSLNPQQAQTAAGKSSNPKQTQTDANKTLNPKQAQTAADKSSNPQQTQTAASNTLKPQQVQTAADTSSPQQTQTAANKTSNPQQAHTDANKTSNPQQTQTAANKTLNQQQAGTAADKSSSPQQAQTAAIKLSDQQPPQSSANKSSNQQQQQQPAQSSASKSSKSCILL